MAGPQSELKFIKMLFLVGFGAFSGALLLQRRELLKHGYDLHLSKSNIDHVDLTLLLDANGNPVSGINNAKKLGELLDKFKHANKTHTNKDTGMDNRFLILKNEYHGPAPAGSAPGTLGALHEDYYRYSQDKTGKYTLNKINNLNLLNGIDLINSPFKAGEFTQIKRNTTVVNNLLAQSKADGHDMASNKPRFTESQLERLDVRQKQKLLLFSGGLLAAEIPSLLAQAKSSGSYALMNKVGSHAPGDTESFNEKVNKMLAPVRSRLNI